MSMIKHTTMASTPQSPRGAEDGIKHGTNGGGGGGSSSNKLDQFDLTRTLNSYSPRESNGTTRRRHVRTQTPTAPNGARVFNVPTFRRQSQPPEELEHDDVHDRYDRCDSAESFDAYKKKHVSPSRSRTLQQQRRPSIGHKLAAQQSLRRNIARTKPKLDSRESFELKQQALHSLQLDGTLQQISNLDHLCFEEEWSAKQNIWRRLAIRASTPDTSQKELIQRSTFLIISALTVGAGMLWGLMYVALGEWLAALMPFIYSTVMGGILMTCVCYSKNKYEFVVNCQLTLILVLPIAVHLALGGMERSGGVMLWSFLCPMGAAFFRSAKSSLSWFYVYMTLSAILLCLDQTKNQDGNDNVVTAMYFAMNILGVKSVIFAGVFFFARELETEYNKSEEVLSNILPSAIVTRIKRGEFPIVDHVAGVSILFADLVGFTKASTELHPNFLIGLFLRDVFQSFDELVYRHKLEKIKTIGDAYMVVGGLNHCGDSVNHDKTERHTERIMVLATDMFTELKKINSKYNLQFELRIGIHRGPVVAGVLGLKRFTYDVWGDSVNTASRMESNGVPGRIHMSSEMYECVQDMPFVDFECCGKRQIKGKGEMTTYIAKPRETSKLSDLVTPTPQDALSVHSETSAVFHGVDI